MELVQVSEEVFGSLPHLGESQLLDLVTLSGIDKEKVKKAEQKGVWGLRCLLMSFLSGDEVEGLEDGGLELFKKVQARLVVVSVEKREAAAGTGSAETKGESATVTPAWTADKAGPIPTVKEAPRYDSLLRKEFRIKGQIGEVGQKDKLSFSSLVHQIDRGVARGYAEEEVVDAIINAMVPGLTLRSYLECKPELDLPVLRRLLRSHYQEKEATELYHDLTGAVQSPRESPQEFLLRMLALRQKILFASKEADATFRYDATLVQGMFLHSLLTGVTSENIKSDLKPLLQNVNTSDEVLLERINIAANNESERNLKQGTAKRTKINEVSTTKVKESHPNNQASNANLDMKMIHESIRTIVRSELAAVAPAPQATLTPPTVEQRYRRARRPDWGCRECRLQGNGESCNHCFRCGSSEHFARGCNNRPTQAGNAGGASERGEGFPGNTHSPGQQQQR
eukprot:XP_011682508.1 PREDICTED: uncharacterized protein LOC105446855 [Strongylocentrotus purpuratus]